MTQTQFYICSFHNIKFQTTPDEYAFLNCSLGDVFHAFFYRDTFLIRICSCLFYIIILTQNQIDYAKCFFEFL